MADLLQLEGGRRELGGKAEVRREEDKIADGEGGLGSTSQQPKRAQEDASADHAMSDLREDEEEAWDHYGPDLALEDAFEGLNLHGEEEEDLDLSREVEELIRDVRWLALFRVHTMRPFSHSALLNSMRNAWACAQGITFNIKGPNLFLAQCHCLGDWKRVMEGGRGNSEGIQ